MHRLTVLYDGRCGLCSYARHWMEAQPQIVPLELLAADSDEARRRFPTLASSDPEELVAVSDEGDVYRGPNAWIVCLWALREFRDWSFRFAQPRLLPLAREIVEWLSTRRHALSRALRLMSDADIVLEIEAGRRARAAACEDDGCLPHERERR